MSPVAEVGGMTWPGAVICDLGTIVDIEGTKKLGGSEPIVRVDLEGITKLGGSDTIIPGIVDCGAGRNCVLVGVGPTPELGGLGTK
jgi:hypothetical protein